MTKQTLFGEPLNASEMSFIRAYLREPSIVKWILISQMYIALPYGSTVKNMIEMEYPEYKCNITKENVPSPEHVEYVLKNFKKYANILTDKEIYDIKEDIREEKMNLIALGYNLSDG